jgi:hypothetical protein
LPEEGWDYMEGRWWVACVVYPCNKVKDGENYDAVEWLEIALAHKGNLKEIP